MALTREQKAEQLQEIKASLQKAQSVIFAQYIGMNVAEVSDFRRKLKEGGAEMKVAKKTLMKIAAKETDLPEIPDDVLPGPVACIFSYTDPLSGAQVALTFSKDHPQVAFLGGIFEGRILTQQEAAAMATIPSREVLLATFAGMLQSPLRSFASMLQSPLSGFARGLKQLAEKGGVSASGATTVEPAPAKTDATGDPIDPETGGRTEVTLAEDLSGASAAVVETPTEAAPEGSSESPESSESSPTV